MEIVVTLMVLGSLIVQPSLSDSVISKQCHRHFLFIPYSVRCSCRYSDWTRWSSCDSLCIGQRRRSRRLISRSDSDVDCSDARQDIQSCKTYCFNSGTLYMSHPRCVCKNGFKGRCCESHINPCEIDPCQNGATCVSLIDVYTCQCDRGWRGNFCETEINPCRSSPCQNGATCINKIDYYVCSCARGWNGKNCERDIQPPIFLNCPDKIDRLSSTPTCYVNWTKPSFHDPMGHPVQVTANYPDDSFEFPWGVFTIQYVGLKESNGLITTCAFNVSVKPFPCPALQISSKAALVCNNWETDYGKFCLGFCRNGLTIARGHIPGQMFACGASGNWFPSNSMPNCEVEVDTPTYGSDEYYSYSNCSSDIDVAQMKRKYITQLKESHFKYFCTKYGDACSESNISVDCHA